MVISASDMLANKQAENTPCSADMRSDPNGDEGVACLSARCARFPRGQPENTWALTAIFSWGRGFHNTPFIRAEGLVGLTAYSTQHEVECRVPIETPLTEAWEAKWI